VAEQALDRIFYDLVLAIDEMFSHDGYHL
jgi:hypothetical protein